MWLFAVPLSFYESIFPENSIDIFICMTTIHWLDINDPVPFNEFIDENLSLINIDKYEAGELRVVDEDKLIHH